MRALLLTLAVLTLLAAPLAAADHDYQGACIRHKGTTGVSVSVANCVPVEDERLDRYLGDGEVDVEPLE